VQGTQAICLEGVLASAVGEERWYLPLYLLCKNKYLFDFSQRCDGKQPICGQCDRAGRAEDCEYTIGQERSKVQILEEMWAIYCIVCILF
jgi:hypothetical protein